MMWSAGVLLLGVFATGCGVAPEVSSGQRNVEVGQGLGPLVCEAATIDPEPSLLIRDRQLLREAVPFRRFFEHMVASQTHPMFYNDLPPGETHTSHAAKRLFQRWWDTQNRRESAAFEDVPHCNDDYLSDGSPAQSAASFMAQTNGFPMFCPRPEGILAYQDPFDLIARPEDAPYQVFEDEEANNFAIEPIAVINRFDLTPNDYSSCGEIRIVYALVNHPTEDVPSGGTVNMIFEAHVPNPSPGCASGCRELAETWAGLSTLDLSEENDRQTVVSTVEELFFGGIGEILPIASWQLYEGETGRVRTNQFLQISAQANAEAGEFPNGNSPDDIRVPWDLREFRMVQNCRFILVNEREDSASARDASPHPYPRRRRVCELQLLPKILDNHPNPILFADDTHELAAAFRADFIAQLPNLLQGNSLFGFDMKFAARYSSASSMPVNDFADFPAVVPTNYISAASSSFRAALEAELGVTATNQALTRASFLTCSGCHRTMSGGSGIMGVVEPFNMSPVNFRYFATDNLAQFVPCAWDSANSPSCTLMSPAFTNTFVPQRKAILEAYLGNDATCYPCAISLPPDIERVPLGDGQHTIGGTPVRSHG